MILKNKTVLLSKEEFLILKSFNYNYFVVKRDKLDEL
jgi:hypothetical protein